MTNPSGPAQRSATPGPVSPVLVVGEALIDVVRHEAQQDHQPSEDSHPGGSPANVAVGLGQLGHAVNLATWIARDEHGAVISAHLRDAGVGIIGGSDGAPKTPVATATVDGEGVAIYDFDLTWQLPHVDPVRVGHLHTGSIAATLEPGGSAVLDLMLAAREHTTISYDPNLRPSIMGSADEVRPRIEECIGASDVVKASEEDVEWLHAGASPEEVAGRWGRLGAALVVITRGGDGALVYRGSGESFTVAAQPVQVADTVGAGDSFMAGLLSGLLDAGLLGEAPARERLRVADRQVIADTVARGMSTGAYTVQRAGAVAPTRRDLGIR